jgi:hypothetical protein
VGAETIYAVPLGRASHRDEEDESDLPSSLIPVTARWLESEKMHLSLDSK